MDYLLVIDNATGDADMMTVQQAADRTGIDAHEIASTIEESGRCNSMDYLILDTRPAEDAATA